MPKISVIIPCYNVEKYLKECLDSVINQTLKDIEIICVDDGSTDNSLKILNEYGAKDNRIKIINNIKNKGAGYARNCALKIAKGDYLAFIDGDDFYELTYLEELYNKASTTNADIIICSAKMFDNKKNEYKEMPWALRNDLLPSKDLFNYKDISKFIFNFSQNWNWNKLFKHSFIKTNKILFQEIYRTNDLFFTCKALVLADSITTVNKPLINYRTQHGNSCQQSNEKYPYDFYYAFKALKEFLIEQKLYDTVRQSYINWALGGLNYNIQQLKRKVKTKDIKTLLKNALKELDISHYKEIELYDKNYGIELENNLKIYNQSIIKKIFSMNNQTHGNTKHKVITILGIKIKLRRKNG